MTETPEDQREELLETIVDEPNASTDEKETEDAELPDPEVCDVCPRCGCYPLEKDKSEREGEETIFYEDCPACNYANQF